MVVKSKNFASVDEMCAVCCDDQIFRMGFSRSQIYGAINCIDTVYSSFELQRCRVWSQL